MKSQTVLVAINVSPEERAAIHEIAQKRGYRITSDYIRGLIERDCAVNGIDFKFEVDRGGYRGKHR